MPFNMGKTLTMILLCQRKDFIFMDFAIITKNHCYSWSIKTDYNQWLKFVVTPSHSLDSSTHKIKSKWHNKIHFILALIIIIWRTRNLSRLLHMNKNAVQFRRENKSKKFEEKHKQQKRYTLFWRHHFVSHDSKCRIVECKYNVCAVCVCITNFIHAIQMKCAVLVARAINI